MYWLYFFCLVSPYLLFRSTCICLFSAFSIVFLPLNNLPKTSMQLYLYVIHATILASIRLYLPIQFKILYTLGLKQLGYLCCTLIYVQLVPMKSCPWPTYLLPVDAFCWCKFAYKHLIEVFHIYWYPALYCM